MNSERDNLVLHQLTMKDHLRVSKNKYGIFRISSKAFVISINLENVYKHSWINSYKLCNIASLAFKNTPDKLKSITSNVSSQISFSNINYS